MVNGVLYTVTGLGLVAALDPATGHTRWIYDPESYEAGRPNNVGFVQRGLGYWTDGTEERLLLGTSDAYLISLDARTGTPDARFGSDGNADLTVGVRGAIRVTNFTARRPFVAGGVVVVGNSISDSIANKEMPPGDVQGFDVRTGERLWTFHTVPRKGEFGYETWEGSSADYSGNTNVWNGMAYDPELDYVYFATTTPTNDYYGGQRLGDNLFAESLVCVEAKTGKRVWHFQAVHHGLWDYDFPAPPILGDITVNGRQIKAAIQVSKQAFIYVLDRETGEPVWPIEERPVPPSEVPGERPSPTQPFPTKPPAFDVQGSTEENLLDFTPELRKLALAHIQTFVHGRLFTPPSLEGTLSVPGNWGAASWGGAAFDPVTGVLYVPSRTLTHLQRITPVDPEDGNARYRIGSSHDRNRTPEDQSAPTPDPPTNPTMIDGLPLWKPPYSRVTAIDMNKGEHLWMAPLGNGPRNHPRLKNLNLPPLGDGVRGLPLVTKTLLFVSTVRVGINGVPQAPDTPVWGEWGDPDEARKLLYVFDKLSGELLREIELDVLTASVPMTYSYNGKQYIVMAVGVGETSELVALSLP